MSKSRTSSRKKRPAARRASAPKKKRKAAAPRAAARRAAPRLVGRGAASGLLLVISGPSGAGKSTIARRVSSADARIWRSVSMTTRSPRPGETVGIDYLFVTREEFERALAEKSLLEHASVYGEHYGTPRGPVAERLSQGRDVLLEIDVQGALQVRKMASEAILIFVAPPNRAVLESRLRDRHTDSEERIQARLAAADAEVARAKEYDYYIVNDDLDRATSDVTAVIAAERTRVQRKAEIAW